MCKSLIWRKEGKIHSLQLSSERTEEKKKGNAAFLCMPHVKMFPEKLKNHTLI